MIKKCAVLNGLVINIGEWDYQIEQVEVKPAVIDEETQAIIEPAEYEEIIRNPFPEGATIEEREVVYDDVYGWRLADAPTPVSDKERIEALESALLEVILGD